MERRDLHERSTLILRLAFVALLCGPETSFAQADLEAAFRNPPPAARPRVWWHWMNGNITQDGIRKDLEWMKRVGIGGFQNFDASLATPQIVDRRLVYMTPEWKEAFQFAVTLAAELGMEVAIAGSPGWSESGGPWVPAKDGMKKYVWTATRVSGGAPFSGRLLKPADTTGPIQNARFVDSLPIADHRAEPPRYYADALVVAYRRPASDVPFADWNPKITSSGGKFEIAQLTDGDLATTSFLPPAAVGEDTWIQFELPEPHTVKALTIASGDVAPRFQGVVDRRSLQASDDGSQFREVVKIPTTRVPYTTLAIPPVEARFFRVTFKTLAPQPNRLAQLLGLPQTEAKPSGTDVAEIVLHDSYRIHRLEEKAGFVPEPALERFVTPESSHPLAESDVVELTSRMKADGSLDWDPPPGDWVVLRLGYSLLGIKNHPASPEATGLEVDKLDARAVADYLTTYLDQYAEATGGLMGKDGVQFMITDSYEAGGANWTAALPAEFRKRRGYDLASWVPVLTGQIIRSSTASERFLWDFRRTLAELMAENHYDQIGELLRERGMGRYTESHENGRAMIADGMEVKRKANVPMSAMWTPSVVSGGDSTRYQADIRESASVAHLYGQNLVAAESLTALGLFGRAWSYSPENLKPTADLELASGLNRFVIHTSVHQPTDDEIPGLGLGPFGQWFTRHETWAEYAGAWTDYLSRSSYLLQQGRAAADILYFYGEDTNITALFGQKLPDIPEGYELDFVNADALVNVVQAKDGRLTTPSGMIYRVLVLDENARRMSLPVLEKIRDLVADGILVTGVRPETTPSLADDETRFRSIVEKVWGSGYKNVSTRPLADVLAANRLPADFTYTRPQPDTKLLYVHRTLPETEIYWLNNRRDRPEEIEASFRVAGKKPELWRADTGEVAKASYRIENGRTLVPLRLEPNDALFVVFREDASSDSETVPQTTAQELVTVKGPWNVSFQPGRGAPASATFDELASWSESGDAGIKYFSGTAAYETRFELAPVAAGARIVLDLGGVKDLAEVLVNSKSLGVVWKRPFRIDVSSAVVAGENSLEVRVTNLWVNRLIGDAQPNAKRIAYTTMPFYETGSPLLPSGLLGPVKVLAVR
jgi:hypothetical protein